MQHFTCSGLSPLSGRRGQHAVIQGLSGKERNPEKRIGRPGHSTVLPRELPVLEPMLWAEPQALIRHKPREGGWWAGTHLKLFPPKPRESEAPRLLTRTPPPIPLATHRAHNTHNLQHRPPRHRRLLMCAGVLKQRGDMSSVPMTAKERRS